MDVEAPSPYGYGEAPVRAVKNGLLSEGQLDESVRRVLRDKFALGLFDNPYVAEDPVAISSVASEGDELSHRLSDEAVTLLKNDGGILPLDRDVSTVAVIGPHADSVMVGFPQYTFPAGVAMTRVAAKLGSFPMPGVGELPEEGRDRSRTTPGPTTQRSRLPRRFAGWCPMPRSPRSWAPGCRQHSRPTSPRRSPPPSTPTWSSCTSAARPVGTATT
jgi:beta-glucosidase